MKKLTVPQQIEALQNALKHYNFDDNYQIMASDRRVGLRYAIVTDTNFGGLQTITNYMTYEEFNAFLFGYDAATKSLLLKKP